MTTQTDGAIGYVEYAYAKQNKMANIDADQHGAQGRRPGRGLVPGRRGERGLEHRRPGYYLILTDQAGANSWPITGASFILVYAKPPDAAATGEALKFFDWAYKNGGKMAADLDYVPLPTALDRSRCGPPGRPRSRAVTL